ncbi:sensor histidine kinase [Paenibacillus sp. HB172176]|uniref:ATP-binding protein n=1 Tax=Paenibacillus sp. HB172176 TaxID=2493690 RepID=UPI00143C2B99|nr:sensor histidine kinase [Paenibacillus sp. HB172176]
MLVYFKDFIINVFFIFSPLVFYPYIYKTKSNPFLYPLFMYSLFAFALVITMTFPIKVGGIIYDFRSVPLVLGSLYGGLPVLGLLYVTLQIYRYCMGSPHGIMYALALLPSMIIMALMVKRFAGMKLSSKIIFAILLSFLIKLLTFTIYLRAIDQIELLFNKPIAIVETYLIQAAVIALCVYLIEFLNRHFHMQEEIARSEKIMIVSDLAASVAHEIRNPLTVVKGFIQLLGSDNISKEKNSYYKQICLEELQRAEIIINDYLSLAKPDPETVEDIHVRDELDYLSNLLNTYAVYNNIGVETESGSDSKVIILGDKYKFRQAIINIGKNAIEAMSKGGMLRLGMQCSNESVTVSVQDNGVGMSSEQIKRLGIPYYSTKDKGTGLGTMVSFAIIKKMNGKIDIKSEVGKGTVCKLIFPRKMN